MKLKLEKKDEIQILVVTEDFLVPHAAILRVGLTKMLKTGIKELIVNLSAAAPIAPEAVEKLGESRGDAEAHDVRLVFVAPNADWADCPSVDEAIARLKSPLGDLLSEEAKLTSQLRRLQRRKQTLEQSLSGDKAQDVKTLRRENSDLKTATAWLEALVEPLSRARREPSLVASTEKKIARVKEILSAVLEQEGLLPLK
ncbi:MAG: hypothetical protein IT285_10860 [Bdellovibrionales bacterium]|nr:hypothetical protein [Bdellovibrionales bacterium]